MLQRCVDHSLLSRGNPNFIVDIFESPAIAHEIRKDPSLDDNELFKMKQQEITVKIVKEMVKVAVTARRCALILEHDYTERQLLSFEDSADAAVAHFYANRHEVEDQIDFVDAVMDGWKWLEEELWPGIAKTREEMARFIIGKICDMVVNGDVDLVKE